MVKISDKKNMVTIQNILFNSLLKPNGVADRNWLFRRSGFCRNLIQNFDSIYLENRMSILVSKKPQKPGYGKITSRKVWKPRIIQL
jgi:hypothetical protein